MFVGLVTVCITVSSIYLSFSLGKNERSKTEEVYKSECQNLVNSFEDKLYAIQKCGNYVRYDETVAKCIEANTADEFGYITSVDLLLGRYRSIYNMILLEEQVKFNNMLFINDNLSVSEGIYEANDYTNFDSVGSVLSTTKNIKNENWYNDIVKANGALCVYFRPDSSTLYALQLIRNGDLKAEIGNYVGISVVSFDIRSLLAAYATLREEVNILVKYNDNIVACLSDNIFLEGFNDKKYDTTIFDTKYGVEFVLLIDKVKIDISTIGIVLLSAMLLVACVGLLLSYLLSRYMTRPIIRLSDKIANVIEDDDGYLENRNDEIGMLYKSYLEMQKAVKEYTHKFQEEERKRIELEFKLYQYRISPHMLYNTLDSISWLAMEDGNDKIIKMNALLAELYRSSVKSSDFMTSVGEELEFVTTYVKLQQFRYGGKINFETNCEDDFKSIKIPQCIIQPFVENSILHNFNLVEDMHIKVTVSCIEESLQIVIEDNGICRDIKALAEGHRHGTGISNVIARIKLKYAERSGVIFNKSDMGGLRVSIHLYEDKLL